MIFMNINVLEAKKNTAQLIQRAKAVNQDIGV